MIRLDYPEPGFKIKLENGRHHVFDGIRKTWLLLTPEEWVRQNFIQYLIEVLRYPSSLIAIEKELMLHDIKKRFDLLVYDNQHQPWMLVECKAPDVVLHDAALQQVLRYNISIPVSFLVITNGATTYAWEKVDGQLKILDSLPSW
jgi:hypothetical protein